MKKILLSVFLIIALFSFTACNNSGDNNSQNNGNVTETVTPTAAITDTPVPTESIAGTSAPTEAPTEIPTEVPTEAPTETPTETPTSTPEVTPIEELTPSPTETPLPVSDVSFFPVDVDNQRLSPVYEAYLDYMNNRTWSDFTAGRFTLAYIDDDDIPELLVLDGDYHGAGVEIVKYDSTDSTARKIDSFGSWGSMNYLPGQSAIFSFWMGQGYECYYSHEINGFTAEMTSDLEMNEENAEYTINGIASDSETFNEVLEIRLSASEDSITIGYSDGIPFAPIQDTAIFSYITNVISQGVTFKMPASQGIEDIDGRWNLFYGIVTDSSTGDILTSDDCHMAASIGIDSINNSASFWCTFNDELYDDYTMVAEYVDEPLIASNEYALWTLKLFGESPNDIYNLTAYVENDTEYLYLSFETLISDADTRTFEIYLIREKTLNFENAATAYAKYNKKASDLDNGIAAFTCYRFITVSADQTDLISEYGLTPDLDGFDYTIVEFEDEKFTLYVNTNDTVFRYYEITDSGMELVTASSFDEFRKHIKNEHAGIMPVFYSEDDAIDGNPLSYLVEECYLE